MPRRKYDQLVDGEGQTVPAGEIFRFACCDCGLVHDMALVPGKLAEKGLIGIAVRRNARATVGRRRTLGVIEIVRKKPARR